MSYAKRLEEITSSIYRGVQLPGNYTETRKLEAGDRHVVRLLTASAISNKLLGAPEGIISDFFDLERLKDEKSYSRYYLEDGDLVLTARGKSLRVALIKISHDELVIPNGSVIVVRHKAPENATAFPYNETSYYCYQTFAYLSHLLRNGELDGNPLESPLFVGKLKSLEIPFYDNPMHSKTGAFMENITRRAELLKELKTLDEALPKFDFRKPETPEEKVARLKEIKKIVEEYDQQRDGVS